MINVIVNKLVSCVPQCSKLDTLLFLAQRRLQQSSDIGGSCEFE